MNKPNLRLENDLITQNYTEIFHEHPEDIKFNAPHHFKVFMVNNEIQGQNPPKLLAEINFQEGPIKENGINGIANEDLIAMVICRLEGFQKSEFKSRDNACAITKLEEALLWLRKRTLNRVNRKVEGTSIV